jgi:DNA polymerase
MTTGVSLKELERLAAKRPPALEGLSENLVFGTGDPDAKLMIVGEAPGEDEDLSGEPFVGRAGQLLDKVLESVGIARDAVYITNIVKFRPPGNRNPKPDEVKASEPVLLEQIKLVQPQVIAPLGNVPTQWFLGTKEGITHTRGRWYEWHGIKVFPLFHPAYLLRNPSRERGSPKWLTWNDMKELKRVLDSLPPKDPNIVIDTAEQGGLF